MQALIRGPQRVRAFTIRALQRARDDERAWWEDTLGVRWDSETIHKIAKTVTTQKDQEITEEDKVIKAAAWHRGVKVPLTMLLAPHDFIEHLAKQAPLPGQTGRAMPVALGDYRPEADEQIISLGDADKETFFNVLGVAGIYPGARPRAAQASQVDSEREAARHASSTPLHTGPKRDFKGRMKEGLPEYDARPRRKKPKPKK